MSLMEEKKLHGHRKIIRIAVTPEAKTAIERWARPDPDGMDMTEMGVASRVYEWFGHQSDEIQRGVLGMYGRLNPVVARMVLEKMAQQDSANPPAAEQAASEAQADAAFEAAQGDQPNAPKKRRRAS